MLTKQTSFICDLFFKHHSIQDDPDNHTQQKILFVKGYFSEVELAEAWVVWLLRGYAMVVV